MLRHTQPWSLRQSNPEKCERIRDIQNNGYGNPIFMVLDTARSKKELAMKERVLIARFREEHDLLNIQLNRRKKCSGLS
jgi:hypothetical protein